MRLEEVLNLLRNIRFLNIILFLRVEAKLSLIQGMISSKFRSEDCAKRIGSAGIVIRAADHARERSRRNKAASAQQFDRHRIGLQAVYDESLAQWLSQKYLKEVFRSPTAPGHPR